MKTKALLYIFLMFALCSVSLAAEVEIKSQAENHLEFTIKGDTKTRNIILLKLDEVKEVFPDFAKNYKAGKEVDFKSDKSLGENIAVIYDGTNSEYVTVKGLTPKTKYTVSIYTAGSKTPKNMSAATLAPEPKKQASGIAFKNTTDSQIGILFRHGDGEQRIILASNEEIKDFPADGKEYKSGNFGDESCKIGNAYVVYNSAADKTKGMEALVENLKYGKYYFQVLEYNGTGSFANYNINKDKSNPRHKFTNLPAPVALEASGITADGFMANWKPIDGVKFFEFDLSVSPDFSTFVEMYNSADVGNSNAFEFAGLEKGTYYYRLRAVNDVSKSANSNVIKLVIK